MAALQALRAEQEPAAANGDTADASDPTRAFPPGSVAIGTVHEVKEYGIVCDMDKHPVRPSCVRSTCGSRLRVCVRDTATVQGTGGPADRSARSFLDPVGTRSSLPTTLRATEYLNVN